MTREVEWSNRAIADIVDIITYILTDSSRAAEGVSMRIRETGNALGHFATGHPGRIGGTYEKSVSGLPYIILYSLIDGDRSVSILRVIHSSRDWDAEQWPE